MDQITPKEVKILENPEDIQERREQVLGRYANFKAEARNKRDKLEDSRRFQVRKLKSIVFAFVVAIVLLRTVFFVLSILSEMRTNSKDGFTRSCKPLRTRVTKIRLIFKRRYRNIKRSKPKLQLIRMP